VHAHKDSKLKQKTKKNGLAKKHDRMKTELTVCDERSMKGTMAQHSNGMSGTGITRAT
jgi:hypothetical protein